MKVETKKILKEKQKIDLFTDERYEQVKDLMKHRMSCDIWLNNYLSLDPSNKAEWCADHLVLFVERGLI
jgi:hypothetical protein